MCFFIVYLLKIITSIIKANTIIVSRTKPNKSKYIISNKTASIIAPPPHSQHKLRIKSGKPHLLIRISYVSQYNIRKQKKIFRNDILIESFFDNNVHESSDYTINVDTMKEILETLKEIKDIIQNPIFSDSK